MKLLKEIAKLARTTDNIFEAKDITDITGVRSILECGDDKSCKCAEGNCGGNMARQDEEEEDFSIGLLPDHMLADIADEVLVAMGNQSGERDLEPAIINVLQMYAEEDAIPGLDMASEEEFDAIVKQVGNYIISNK